jgi:diacylglycerol kinase family enzyme
LVNDKNYLFLINPRSGKLSVSRKESLVSKIARHEKSQICVTQSEMQAKQLARDAMLAGQIVIACGGDGFHNIIAQQAVDTGGLMSVLPLGRGNDFAKSVGIHSFIDTKRAITNGNICNARYINVEFEDYHRISLTCAGVGLLSEAAERASKLPILQGKLLYCVATLLSFIKLNSHKYNLMLDDQSVHEELLIFAGAASEYTGGGIFIAPEARKVPARMNVLFAKSVNRRAALLLLGQALFGKHLSHEKVTSSYFSRCRIQTETENFWSSLVYGDGEFLGVLPATLNVGDRPLKVLVPKD